MHPWEDSAETFAAYLELTGVLYTANNVGLGPVPDVSTADFPEMVDAKRRLSVAMNEMNRMTGLIDLYPKILITPAVE